jgi:hypothetical protein
MSSFAGKKSPVKLTLYRAFWFHRSGKHRATGEQTA